MKTESKSNKETGSMKVLYPPYIIYMFSRLWFSLLWLRKIRSINKKNPIKVIHAQDTGYSGLAAVFAGKILKIPVIITSHGIRHKLLEKKFTGKFSKLLLKFERSLDFFTVKRCDRLIAINPIIKKYYEDVAKDKIDFIPIPIDSKKFLFSENSRKETRSEFDLENNTVVVGFVGRLAPEKNVQTLVQAFASAQKINITLKLILIGSGILESKLKDEVSKEGIDDKVIFCGVRDDIPRLLSGLDIFVLPSYVEGLSTALLESMTCNRAIICSNIPANKEVVIDNKEGILIDPDNVAQLEKAILSFAKNENLRIELGNNAKKKASQYDEELIFPKILQLYQNLVKSK